MFGYILSLKSFGETKRNDNSITFQYELIDFINNNQVELAFKLVHKSNKAKQIEIKSCHTHFAQMTIYLY